MTYLDYSTTTPISLDALDTYVKVSKEYYASSSSNHNLGTKSLEFLNNITKEISNIFNVMEREIIYTSGGTEANNMALIGVALERHNKGRHIITSKLEHPSIYKICNYLESLGFEISYVDNDDEGLIIFDDLKRLIRDDTILVSICAVNYDTGVRQPLKMLRQIIKKENEATIFHSDLTQAIGKTPINFRDIDLGSISAHKFYGPKGIGFLYKNDSIKLVPLLYGENKNNISSNSIFPIPLIASMKEALKTSLKELEKREKYINLLNDRITSKLSKLEGIEINKTKYSIPYIINISLTKVNINELINNLANKDICVGTYKQGEIASGVMAIYKDLNRSKSCLKISLSHMTTVLEINRFLEIFEVEYNKLLN